MSTWTKCYTPMWVNPKPMFTVYCGAPYTVTYNIDSFVVYWHYEWHHRYHKKYWYFQYHGLDMLISINSEWSYSTETFFLYVHSWLPPLRQDFKLMLWSRSVIGWRSRTRYLIGWERHLPCVSFKPLLSSIFYSHFWP